MDNEWHVLGLGNDRSTIFVGSTGDALLLARRDLLPGLGGPQCPIALATQPVKLGLQENDTLPQIDLKKQR